MKILLKAIVPLLLFTAVAPRADAAVLIFETDTGGAVASDTPVPQGYGDNIAAATQGGFSYGTAGGFTPNVAVSYSSNILGYQGGYGDLDGLVYFDAGTTHTITFTAETGYTLALDSLDFAGYLENRILPSLTVSNGTDPDYVVNNISAPGGNGSTHTTVSVAGQAAATGETVTLTFTTDGSFNVATSNIQFSQVPEPSSLLLLGLSGVSLLAIRRRRRG